MNLSLEGKNAIICGSSQGIGYAIAEELALMGANCILLARNEETLKLAVFQLDISIRQSHAYHVIDFNDQDATGVLIQKITSEQKIHILVNNTSGPPAGPVVDATEDQFLLAFKQHLIVINIISTSVKVPLKNLGVSNTIRGAVASWAKTMANELGEFGITVNNILPGATRTQRLEAIINNTVRKTGATTDEVEKELMSE